MINIQLIDRTSFTYFYSLTIIVQRVEIDRDRREKKRSSLEKYHLKQRIRELEDKRSHIDSTTLVTLYIPPGTQLSDISALLTSELGTAHRIGLLLSISYATTF